MREPGETCDGDCPTSCDDSDACTLDAMTGSAANCNVACTHSQVVTCRNNDGCCPAGCTPANDADCTSHCGNGVREPGETCDGDCPTSCNDHDACTLDSLSGTPSACNVVCTNTPITACQSADGCCPSGCSYPQDSDCGCVPTTCEALGLQCGTADNGCGATLECGGCPAGSVCTGGVCVASSRGLGDPCASDADCDSAACIEQPTDGWTDGYCSKGCLGDAECGYGNHCGFRDGNGRGVCLKGCSSSSGCRAGYECWDIDGDGTNTCAPVGSGSGPVGAACLSYADCGGGRGGLCATQAQHFKGGYCSFAACSATRACPAGSHCAFRDGSGNGACAADCSSNASCRADGYGCFDADNDARSECWPAATGTAAVGAGCAEQWDCAGGRYGFCGQAPDWPGGYCLVQCGSGFPSCPSGTECVPFAPTSESYCLDRCAGAYECRTGYRCSDENGSGTTECNPQ